MTAELLNLLLGTSLNFLVAFIIVRFIYYPKTPAHQYVFTFLAFNTIIFFVIGLLTSVEISVGVGFGLFAIFSVLRYRTDEVPIREMTYLFIIIALPVMNSIIAGSQDYLRLLVANAVLIGVLWFLEKGWGFHYESSQKIIYKNMELIKPANREQLLADLRQQTGLPVKRVQVGRLNLANGRVQLKVFYDEADMDESA